ncbi:MAG: NAD/NADP octopine/nopaline dehydrogenase family protein [Candidatus Thorarchaeota archaeon]
MNKALDYNHVTIIGGGHAGRGLASFLSLQDYEVALYNRTINNVRPIINNGGLDVHGVVTGHASFPLVTDNMSKALEGSGIVIITVPAFAHKFLAYEVAPHLETSQLVLLMPGQTGGALEFARILQSHMRIEDIILGEADSFSFISRTTSPTSVLISKVKDCLNVSAFPASSNVLFLKILETLPLSFKLASNVIETGLGNVNAMLHPTPTILSAGLLESRKGGYKHYHEAISPSVGRLIDRMDAERIQVANAFSLRPSTLVEWLANVYGAKGDTLFDSIHSIDAYDEVGSPETLAHRYVLEDIPTGLVPISYLGKLAGVDTPITNTVTDMACQLYEHNFWQSGRTLIRMGIDRMTHTEVSEYVSTGIKPDYQLSTQDLTEPIDAEIDEL